MTPTELSALDGTPAAPPRSNGELVFEHPWETRAFGLAADLVAGGHFDWSDVQHALIRQIGRWEADESPERRPWSYYEHWLAALEALVAGRELLDGAALEERAHSYAARPHGHDH